MYRRHRPVVIVASPVQLPLLTALALAAGLQPASFSTPPVVEAMKLSPDGKYLALVVVPQSDYESRLLVLDAASLKAVGGLNSSPMHHVGDFWWSALRTSSMLSRAQVLPAHTRRCSGTMTGVRR